MTVVCQLPIQIRASLETVVLSVQLAPPADFVTDKPDSALACKF